MTSRLFANLIPPSSGTRFPALDGLRGLAVLTVLTSHNSIISRIPHRPLNGSVGVCIFFVLSAFLLFYPWVEKRPRLPEIKLYYVRRICRIYPAYMVALLCGMGICFLIPQELHFANPVNFLAHLLFLQSWQIYPASHSLIATAWSLPAEMQFYLLLPPLALICYRWPRYILPFAILAGIAIQFAIPSYKVWASVSMNWPYLALPFFCGMFAAYCVKTYPAIGRGFTYIGLLGLFVFTGLFATLYNVRGIFPSLAIMLLIIGLCTQPKNILSRFFASKPMRFCGIIGYGLFLFHYPIVTLLRHFCGDGIANLLYLPLSFVMATICYAYIETPFMRLAHGLPRHPRSHLFALQSFLSHPSLHS